jgi:hypothetical protein
MLVQPLTRAASLVSMSLMSSPMTSLWLARVHVNAAGEDKVCLGTDYPFPLGETTEESLGSEYTPGVLIDGMAWSPELKRKLLSSNACSWLGTPESTFL